MFDFLCPICNSNDYVVVHGKYKCVFCGKTFGQCDIEKMQNILLEQRKNIEEELNVKFTLESKKDRSGEMLDSIYSKIDNIVEKVERLEKNIPTEELIQNTILQALKGKIDFCDVESFIEELNTTDQFGNFIAGPLYSSMEAILMTKLPYEKKKFVIELDELQKIMEDNFHNNNFKPIYVDKEKQLVEMPPKVRFYQVGLSVKDAETAAKYWSTINMFRHRTSENVVQLEQWYPNAYSRRKFFKSVLTFFKMHDIYK